MIEPRTLPQMIEAAAESSGPRTAIHFKEQAISYSELADAIRLIAAAFKARGIKKGDCVAIALRNSPEFIMAYFALNRLGAVAVPLNFLVSKKEELAFMLNDCKAVGIVTQAEFAKNLLALKASVPSLGHFWTTDMEPIPEGGEDFRSLLSAPSADAPESVPGPDDVACILYTSGTTGRPKGVMLTHANMMTNTDTCVRLFEVGRKDVFMCILPMFHTFAWTTSVLLPLAAEGRIVVVPSITPAKPWLRWMARYGVTLTAGVPQLFSSLTKQAQGFKGLALRYWYFRKVRFVVSGAAPLNPDIQAAFESRLGIPLLEGYGLTETSPAVCANTLQNRKTGAVGRCIPGVQVKIIDETGKELPTGEEGEICVRGPNVMKGYHNNPQATQAAFTQDGWFKTGDVGVLDSEGYLTICDRKKDMIIVKGLKVFPAMIELALLAVPGVEEAAVVGIPMEDGDEIIKCFLVPKKGESIEKAAVQKFLKEKFDPYKRPRDIEIIESLPKNALQKVLKNVLRDRAAESRKKTGAP